MTAPTPETQQTAPHYELMPLIDNRQPPGEQQIVGWATRCLHCPVPIHKTETTEAAETWMDRHKAMCTR